MMTPAELSFLSLLAQMDNDPKSKAKAKKEISSQQSKLGRLAKEIAVALLGKNKQHRPAVQQAVRALRKWADGVAVQNNKRKIRL